MRVGVVAWAPASAAPRFAVDGVHFSFLPAFSQFRLGSAVLLPPVPGREGWREEGWAESPGPVPSCELPRPVA